jgi:hypothetical protein
MKEEVKELSKQITLLIQAFEEKHDVSIEVISVIGIETDAEVNRESNTVGVEITVKF